MEDEEHSTYGTAGGVPVTDELVEQMAEEAEEGYPVERLHRRHVDEATARVAGQLAEVNRRLAKE